MLLYILITRKGWFY